MLDREARPPRSGDTFEYSGHRNSFGLGNIPGVGEKVKKSDLDEDGVRQDGRRTVGRKNAGGDGM